jgi:hypothetical protein
MKIVKYGLFVLIILIIPSCITDSEQYVSINIINNTDEELEVHMETLFSFIYSIPKQSSSTILGIKNTNITLVEKNSGRKHGPRKFFYDETWVIP